MGDDDRVTKRVRFLDPASLPEHSAGGARRPSPPSAPQEPSELPPCTIPQSLIYKMQLDALRAILRQEEEELQHIKNHDEARDKELQILLLRTDIEKLVLLLRSQQAREAAADAESGLVDPAPAPPSALSCVNGLSGRLPRLSIFMLKQVNTLQLELRHLQTQLEYMDEQARGEEEEEVAATTQRIEDVRFLIREFKEHYKADRDKEAATRKWHFEAEAANAKIGRRSTRARPARPPTFGGPSRDA